MGGAGAAGGEGTQTETKATVSPELASGLPLAFDTARVEGFIPHREPIRFVDRVLYLEVGKRAAAVCDLPARRAPVPLAGLGGEAFPRVLLVEVVAQLGAALLGVEVVRSGLSREGEPLPGVLASVSGFELLGEVDVRAPLTVYIEVERRAGKLWFMTGEAHSGARRVARGRISLAVGVAA